MSVEEAEGDLEERGAFEGGDADRAAKREGSIVACFLVPDKSTATDEEDAEVENADCDDESSVIEDDGGEDTGAPSDSYS